MYKILEQTIGRGRPVSSPMEFYSGGDGHSACHGYGRTATERSVDDNSEM